jgi:Uma2 family endonuclease
MGVETGSRRVHPRPRRVDHHGEQIRFTSAPHLVVEILPSDRARDIIRKARKYAAAG